MIAAASGLALAAILYAGALTVSSGHGQMRAGPAPAEAVQYHLDRPKPLDRFNNRQIDLLEKLNRADRSDLGALPEIVVPDRWDLPALQYSPMPRFAPRFACQRKAVVIDLPEQAFGAYEYGRLIRWGPVNTGKRDTPTPPGLYHLNWKSRLHTSSVDSDWKMPYYFNISNHLGIGMHEYQMPGKPASHGCIRMLARDAQWLYHWGRQWDYSDGKKVADGTPVLILGQYHFGDPKPWLQPEWPAQKAELRGSGLDAD